ncbi:MAG TPA: endonuclease/exonuclease/phosphatase family protein [Streptosporangiaceae bacterium]|nr:endonuclease/exonuclease/phosphatase family protein [Streptosporangiaceae bacterium]
MNHDEPITLASLNLHGGLTAGGEPFDVAGACHRLKADVIALQEAWRPAGQPDEVTGAAAELGAQVRHRGLAGDTSRAGLGIGPDPGPGGWGLALLSMLPVTGYQEIELGRAPGDPISRAAQVVTLTMPGGAALRVVNTHLTHRFTSPVQLARLTRRLAARPAVPTVLVGDLNMPYPGTLAAAGYQRTVRGRTYPAARPWIQLDHLLVRGPVRVSGAEVAGPAGSDHLPIRAQLSVG